MSAAPWRGKRRLPETPSYGNCRAVETVENELHVFHRSHRRLENSAKTTAPSFPQFPQPLLLEIVRRKENRSVGKENQNRMDKTESEA
jgi:hypothetical protein